MACFLGQPEKFAQFIAYDYAHRVTGFVEASIRNDYVNGTASSPVAFLEGIYVVAERRRLGIARALTNAVSQWAISRGVRELASDAALENELSHDVHRALGFTETERVVYFRKELTFG
jgi:aminoglycoside 6'-N-acetyltransferase I